MEQEEAIHERGQLLHELQPQAGQLPANQVLLLIELLRTITAGGTPRLETHPLTSYWGDLHQRGKRPLGSSSKVKVESLPHHGRVRAATPDGDAHMVNQWLVILAEAFATCSAVMIPQIVSSVYWMQECFSGS